MGFGMGGNPPADGNPFKAFWGPVTKSDKKNED
jgi:hypothetical protein